MGVGGVVRSLCDLETAQDSSSGSVPCGLRASKPVPSSFCSSGLCLQGAQVVDTMLVAELGQRGSHCGSVSGAELIVIKPQNAEPEGIPGVSNSST